MQDQYPAKKKPDQSTDTLTDSARELHAVMSYMYERDIDSLGYTLDVTFTPKPDAAIYLPGGIRETLEKTFGLPMLHGSTWRLYMTHDRKTDRLSPSTIGAPFSRNGLPVMMVFQHIENLDGYVALEKSSDDVYELFELNPTEAPDLADNPPNPEVFSEQSITTLLAEAGFDLQSHQTMRENIASGLDIAGSFRRREIIDAPITPRTQIILERIDSVLPKGIREEKDTTLSAIIEEVEDDGTRKQLVIEFTSNDYTVDEPRIIERKIVPSLDNRTGKRCYRIEEGKVLKLSEEKVDQLTLRLLEDLGDVA